MTERFLAFFSDFDDGFPPEIAAYLRESITERERLVFICTNPSGHEKTDTHARRKHAWLKEAGVDIARCDVIDDRVAPAQAIALTLGASCIFLMGGDTVRQFRFMEEYGLAEAIRQSRAAVLGLSAGAINMAALSFTLREPPYPGLGLADISITPHFDARKAEAIKAVSYGHPIYAMCDGSAIFAQGKKISLCGEIYKIHQGKIEGVFP